MGFYSKTMFFVNIKSFAESHWNRLRIVFQFRFKPFLMQDYLFSRLRAYFAKDIKTNNFQLRVYRV